MSLENLWILRFLIFSIICSKCGDNNAKILKK